MELRPPEDNDNMGLDAQKTLTEQRAGRVALHLVDGTTTRATEPAGVPAGTKETSQWGGFVAVDLHRQDLVTRDMVKRIVGVVSAALGVEYGASSRCRGTVVTTVFNLPDDGVESRGLLDHITQAVTSEFAEGTVVRSAIEFCDPDAVRLTPTSDGARGRIVPSAVR